MNSRVVTTGLLGGFVGMLWTIIALGLIPVRDSMGWKEAPNEEVVLQALDANLVETGLYIVPGHSPRYCQLELIPACFDVSLRQETTIYWTFLFSRSHDLA